MNLKTRMYVVCNLDQFIVIRHLSIIMVHVSCLRCRIMISGMLCLLIICLIFVIHVCLSFTLHNMSSTF